MQLSLGMQITAQQRAAYLADPFRRLFPPDSKGALLSSAVPTANYQTDAGVVLAGFGDPVGLARDTSRGAPSADPSRPAFLQTVLADRPTRGRQPRTGVRNLLNYSEQFDNAAWVATQADTPVFVSEKGAWRLTANSTFPRLVQTPSLPENTTFTVVSIVEPETAVRFRVQYISRANTVTQVAFVLVGDGTASAGGTIIPLSDGRYECRVTLNTQEGATTPELRVFNNDSPNAASGGWSTDGPGVSFLAYRASVEVGSVVNPYQHRVTINDITEAGVPDVPFYRFNGTNTRLEGNATARDILKGAPGVTFICAFRPASLAANQHLFSFATNAGSVRFDLALNTAGRLIATYRRTDGESSTFFIAPSGGSVVGETKILTVTAEFANGGTGALVFRENGQVVGTADIAGTGNFSDTSSAAVFLARNLGNTQFLNGQLFREIVILGRRASDAEIAAAEARLAALTGVTL